MATTASHAAAAPRSAPGAALRRRVFQAPVSGRCSTIAQAKPKLEASGFVQTDNSGKSNIFPMQQKAFYSSPTTDAAAREGLGGGQGAAVLAGMLAAVAAAMVLVLQTGGSGETLDTVQSIQTQQSLAAIAKRLSASL